MRRSAGRRSGRASADISKAPIPCTLLNDFNAVGTETCPESKLFSRLRTGDEGIGTVALAAQFAGTEKGRKIGKSRHWNHKAFASRLDGEAMNMGTLANPIRLSRSQGSCNKNSDYQN
jgi:hypothetical protein